jgi:hypothetical protein
MLRITRAFRTEMRWNRALAMASIVEFPFPFEGAKGRAI